MKEQKKQNQRKIYQGESCDSLEKVDKIVLFL
jgi:hypothetical protein